jgi:hypothetical protein
MHAEGSKSQFHQIITLFDHLIGKRMENAYWLQHRNPPEEVLVLIVKGQLYFPSVPSIPNEKES